ncbi:hypothetical protein [Saccharopolyspora sp. 5N708]|uniref:hypothetical protein n=1 Tax=Saccharopolyspora sp. 5N708 TaxID=3457424 RepID=UPI003FD00590
MDAALSASTGNEVTQKPPHGIDRPALVVQHDERHDGIGYRRDASPLRQKQRVDLALGIDR